VFNSCSIHPAARNAVGWTRSAHAEVKRPACSANRTSSVFSASDHRDEYPDVATAVGEEVVLELRPIPGQSLRATLTRDFVSSAALVLRSVGGVLCLVLDLVSR
jgi:hypothetical protein